MAEETQQQAAQSTKTTDADDAKALSEPEPSDAVRHIMNLAAVSGDIANMEEVKKLAEVAAKVKKNGNGQAQQAAKETQAAQASTETGSADALTGTTKPSGNETNADDPFGLSASAPLEKFSIKDETELKKVIEEKYAIKDYNTLFNSVDTWRTEAQKYSELDRKWNELVQGLSSLPEPVKNSIDAWSNGKDWNEAFVNAGGGLDYDMDFSQQNKDKVLNKYFPDKATALKTRFDNDEIEEGEYNSLVSTYLDSAEKLYNTDKQNFERQRADLQTKQEASIETMRQSAIGSVKKLKETYRNFNGSELQSIQARLVNGDVAGIFFDKNGNYKEDAAERMALAIHGKKLIDRLTAQAEKRGETKANEQLVGNASDTPSDKKKHEGSQRQAAQGAVQHLGGLFNPDPYANNPQKGQAN